MTVAKPSALLLAVVSLGVAAPAAAEIVCWTDENGNRACGDRVPPQYVKKEREVYDSSGRLIRREQREMTAEEKAALQAEQARAARELEQARYDRFLIQTYETVDDLIRAKEDRLAMIDARIALAEKNQRETGAEMEKLEAAAAAQREQGKALPDKLAEQLAKFRASHAEASVAVRKLTAERARVAAGFDRDIARYRALKAEAGR